MLAVQGMVISIWQGEAANKKPSLNQNMHYSQPIVMKRNLNRPRGREL